MKATRGLYVEASLTNSRNGNGVEIAKNARKSPKTVTAGYSVGIESFQKRFNTVKHFSFSMGYPPFFHGHFFGTHVFFSKLCFPAIFGTINN